MEDCCVMKIQVIPLTEKAETILRSNTDKFGIKKYQQSLLKKVGDNYTTTELLQNPFSIVVTIKPEYVVYINKDTVYNKVLMAVHKILTEHNCTITEVSVELKDG
jgi:hypothetical protein